MFSNIPLPRKSCCRLQGNVENFCVAREAAGDNVAHVHFMLDN
jgi:hypothetical protein